LATRFHLAHRDRHVALSLTALLDDVLSMLSYCVPTDMAELAHLADQSQIVCPLAKVDAFIEMANKNALAVMAALANMAD
jgi:hypothetical protein